VPPVEPIDPQPLTEAARMGQYRSVGWSAYTRDTEKLHASVRGSHRVAVARSGADLVGLARTISDGVTIVYLQDVLVRPEVRRDGLGSRLVRAVLDADPDVRQRVLLTDVGLGQWTVYIAYGYTESHDHDSGH